MRELLQTFKDDGLGMDEVVSVLRQLPFEDLDFAKVDHHRAIRKGFPEVIFGQGKTPAQIAAISQALLQQSDRLLVTRAVPQAFAAVEAVIPEALYDETARTIVVPSRHRWGRRRRRGRRR